MDREMRKEDITLYNFDAIKKATGFTSALFDKSFKEEFVEDLMSYVKSNSESGHLLKDIEVVFREKISRELFLK